MYRLVPNNLTRKKINARLLFSEDEDQKLKRIIKNSLMTDFNSINSDNEQLINWKKVSKEMGNRTPRQCKERYLHYLSPRINKNVWTSEEDSKLISEVARFGKRWKILEKFFKDRTEIDIRNRFYVLQRRISKAARSPFTKCNANKDYFKYITSKANFGETKSDDKQCENNNITQTEQNKILELQEFDKNMNENNDDGFGFMFDFFKDISDTTFDEDQRISNNENSLDIFTGTVYDTVFLNYFYS